MYNNLEHDDTYFHDVDEEIGVTGSGGTWPDIEQIYSIFRYRLILALKEMPTLMGVVEGSTDTWSSVDWQIYSKGLETTLKVAAKPVIEGAELHLQLLGLPFIIEAEYSPVRANQRMVDAQSEQIEIGNELQKIFAGFITQDDASLKLTGTKSVGPIDKEALGAVKAPSASAGTNPKASGSAGGSSKGKSKSGGKGPSKGT